MPDRDVMASLRKTPESWDAVGYEIDQEELDGGETQMIHVIFDFWGFEAVVKFNLRTAESFLEEFRDAVAEGKRKRLEWETETDPDISVREGADGD